MLVESTFVACVIAAGSGLPGLLLPRRSPLGQMAAVLLMVVGCAIGLGEALRGLIEGATSSMVLPGVLPELAFYLKSDPLAAFFQVPIFLLGAVGSVYGLRYWKQSEHSRNGRKLSLCFGLLVSGLGMVTLAGDGITFLFAWEIMALAAFFLVSTEDHKSEARQAGWVYLVATHIGILVLFALFAVLRTATGSFELRRLQPQETGFGLQAVIFLLALAGFGLKAGMMPLHFWLPDAHANAPSHVSALMSGVVLKIGIYGLIRTLTLVPGLSIACGFLVLILGAISAVFGVAFALGQHDLKRLLAYHSIENIGIILIGLGLAMIGLAVHRTEWVILGMGGCLLHVWNHSLFKALLFLAGGSVVHATHTRDIDQLGGLAKRMPRTALLFAVGAIAICGLPPLNGFVSELLIYLGLLRTAAGGNSGLSAIALAAPALAMAGALAAACFVKVYGAVFLGTPRTPIASAAHEASISMIAPMALLAILCAMIGLFPALVLPLVGRVLDAWGGISGSGLTDLVPCAFVTTLSLLLIIAAAVGFVLVRRQALRRSIRAAVTWDCGYARPTARMQYTSSSFASTLVGFFRWLLQPQIHQTRPTDLFPDQSCFESHVPEIVLDGWLNPLWRRVKLRLASARGLQQGRVQRYLLYILLALFALLLSLVPVVELAKRLFGY